DAHELLRKRSKARLLRDGQVRLVNAVFQGTMEQVAALLSEEKGLPWVILPCVMSEQLINKLFCSQAFRSERLEVLIMRYLDEEGVNMEVVSAVTTKTAMAMYDSLKVAGDDGSDISPLLSWSGLLLSQ